MVRLIPLPYIVIFTVFDLLLPLGGIYLHLFNPSMVLSGFTPSPTPTIAAETHVLLDAMAGWFAGLVTLHPYLRLARPNDLSLWRALQSALVLVDVFMLIGFSREIRSKGRTSTSSWRTEDWQNIVGYSFLTLVRTAFSLGLGLDESAKAKIKTI